MDNRDSRFSAEPRRSMCAVDAVDAVAVVAVFAAFVIFVVFVVFVVAVIFAFVFFTAFFTVFFVFFRPRVCVLSRATTIVLTLLGILLDALLDVWCSPDPSDPPDPPDVLAPEEQGSSFDSCV